MEWKDSRTKDNRMRAAASGKKKQTDLDRLTPEESLKLEVAQELGLLDRVLAGGWGTLSAKETGKIGGIIGGRRKSLRREKDRTGESV